MHPIEAALQSRRLRVLIGCECSGVVRDAFRSLGHDAWSCDLLPAEDDSPYHYQEDIKVVMERERAWNLCGFHPPCTFLNVAGIHWNNRGRGWGRTDEALQFVEWCMSNEMPWYLENPISIISTHIRKPDQIIQPYEFGEDASKKTCLWTHKLPLLAPTNRFPGRIVTDPRTGKQVERWSNQTDGGQNKLGPSEHRAADRSRTYSGIAVAMAHQYSKHLLNQ